MKLYYDPNNDKIVEAGIVEMTQFSRDERGNITTYVNKVNELVLLGDIYEEPIDLKGKRLKLSKIEGGEESPIIEGIASNSKLQGGLRFNMRSTKGFNTWSTNLVVSHEWIGKTTIAFHTLSGSLYFLEIL